MAFAIQVSISAVTTITSTTAVAAGVITNPQGLTVDEVGFVISTGSTPTTGNTIFNSTYGGVGVTFSEELTGLLPDTTYYLAAYASSTEPKAYYSPPLSGITFTTLSSPVVDEPLTTTGYRLFLRTDIGDADAIEAQLQAIALNVEEETNADY